MKNANFCKSFWIVANVQWKRLLRTFVNFCESFWIIANVKDLFRRKQILFFNSFSNLLWKRGFEKALFQIFYIAKILLHVFRRFFLHILNESCLLIRVLLGDIGWLDQWRCWLTRQTFSKNLISIPSESGEHAIYHKVLCASTFLGTHDFCSIYFLSSIGL